MSSRKELNQDKILTHLESGMIVELPFAADRPLALFLTRCVNAVSIIIFQCSISWICWSPRIMDRICNTRTAEENTRLSNYTGVPFIIMLPTRFCSKCQFKIIFRPLPFDSHGYQILVRALCYRWCKRGKMRKGARRIWSQVRLLTAPSLTFRSR